jgi:hypothetical protein
MRPRKGNRRTPNVAARLIRDGRLKSQTFVVENNVRVRLWKSKRARNGDKKEGESKGRFGMRHKSDQLTKHGHPKRKLKAQTPPAIVSCTPILLCRRTSRMKLDHRESISSSFWKQKRWTQGEKAGPSSELCEHENLLEPGM